jgi:hypothetical protein
MSQASLLYPIEDTAFTLSVTISGPFDPQLANLIIHKHDIEQYGEGNSPPRFIGKGITIRDAVDNALVALGKSDEHGALKQMAENPIKQRIDKIPTVDLKQGDVLTKVYAVVEVLSNEGG